MVTKWQKDFRLKFNKSFIYLGDEFYLLAERDLPSAEWYDGFPQIENGIGLSRSFLDDWDAIYNKTTSFNKGVDAVIPVGVAAYKVLSPIIKTFNDRAGTEHKLVPVENSFFGSTINVTGLLVGEDILTATKNKKRIILPGKVLNHDNLFLDDMLYDDFVKESKATVEIATTAKDLFILLNR